MGIETTAFVLLIWTVDPPEESERDTVQVLGLPTTRGVGAQLKDVGVVGSIRLIVVLVETLLSVAVTVTT